MADLSPGEALGQSLARTRGGDEGPTLFVGTVCRFSVPT